MKKHLAFVLAGALFAAPFAGTAYAASVEPAAIAAATTPAQHGALASQYRDMAAEARGHAEHHTAMGRNYKGDKWKAMAEHCERLSKLYADQATEYDALAAAHAQASKP